MTADRSYVTAIRAFDTAIRVTFESPDVQQAIDRYLLPALPRCEEAPQLAEIGIAIQKADIGFQVLVNEREVAQAETLDDAALATVKALDDALVRKLRGLKAVHAGAVVLHGRALLIPGLSHAGKSSLVAALLRRGAKHLSDEYALVDETGQIHSYPRPLLLRNSGPRQSLVLPEELNAAFATEPVRVGWIVAVDYDPEAVWQVQQISQAEGVMLLLRNTPHEMAHSPEMLELFTRSSEGAQCYVGTRGEVADACDRILELVTKK